MDEGCLPSVIKGAVGQAEGSQEVPQMTVVPVEERVNTHEGRPPCIGGDERRQLVCHT